jgi:hypothetical protein
MKMCNVLISLAIAVFTQGNPGTAGQISVMFNVGVNEELLERKVAAPV